MGGNRNDDTMGTLDIGEGIVALADLLSGCWNEDFLLTEYDVSQYLSRIEGSPPKRNAAGSIPVWDVW